MSSANGDGRVVDGRYRLESVLGRGGMGVVWRADDELLQRPVAVKEIDLPDYLGDDERTALRRRVMREARASARLNHPGAVTVFDVVEEEGRAFIVMELVEAPSLADVVAREGPLNPERAARIGIQVLDTLEVAHALGIVHRDIKPGNVLLGAGDRAKVADFGIASIEDDTTLTSTGLLVGSPSYMAPERAEGKRSTAAADIWALGTTLWFAVEGSPPFDKGGPIPTLHAVVHEEAPAARRAGALAGALDALLEKDPARRPDAAGARRLLEAALAGDGERTQVAGTAAEPTATVVHEPMPTPTPTPTPTPRRTDRPSLVPLTIGIAVIAAAVIAGVLLVRGKSAPKPAAAPTTTSPTSGAAAPAAAAASASTPSGWTPYTDPATGFRLAYPKGWSVRHNGTLTDFKEPDTGSYLRVDYTRTPSSSPQGDWERLEQSFGPAHAGYRRVHMDPTTFQGFPASNWEYTYQAGDTTLHAVDLGFVAGRFGFALNFQTDERRWARSQGTFEALKKTFVAPG